VKFTVICCPVLLCNVIIVFHQVSVVKLFILFLNVIVQL